MGKILIRGTFNTVCDVMRGGLARLNDDGGTDLSSIRAGSSAGPKAAFGKPLARPLIGIRTRTGFGAADPLEMSGKQKN